MPGGDFQHVWCQAEQQRTHLEKGGAIRSGTYKLEMQSLNLALGISCTRSTSNQGQNESLNELISMIQFNSECICRENTFRISDGPLTDVGCRPKSSVP